MTLVELKPGLSGCHFPSFCIRYTVLPGAQPSWVSESLVWTVSDPCDTTQLIFPLLRIHSLVPGCLRPCASLLRCEYVKDSCKKRKLKDTSGLVRRWQVWDALTPHSTVFTEDLLCAGATFPSGGSDGANKTGSTLTTIHQGCPRGSLAPALATC